MSAISGTFSAPRAAVIARPRLASTPIRVLVVSAALSLPFMILSIVDAGGMRLIWDNLHWSISAVGAAVAAAWSVRGTTARVRAVRIPAAAMLILWMLATLTWAWLGMTGTITVPTLADAFILAILAPGIAIVVATVRGRISAAEETAVFLDASLGFLLIGSLLVYVVGEAATSLPLEAGVAAVAYPTSFIGLAVAGLIAVFAVGQPVAPRGALALLGGTAIIGLAYVGWVLSSVSLINPGEISSMCFTIGALIAAYGAVTWHDKTSSNERYLAFAREATRIIAPTVASLLFLLMLAPAPDSSAGIIRIAIFAASIVFIVRQGLLLRERTAMLARVTSLTGENVRLVGELRCELDRRARDERRMIHASRAAAVGELAAGVAHEVNNPLTGVLGFAELLIDETDPADPRRADLEIIRDEALRARAIVRALRDFASPRPPELAPTDLSVLIRQTIDLVRYSIERRGVTIVEDLPALPPILIDSQAMQQAVLNILANASQAIGGPGRLEVSVRIDGAERVISITDDGVGMDAATASLALDPFFSGRADRPDVEPATGLGLSISNALIESHGGRILITSMPGSGTTVDIRLPVVDGTDIIHPSRGASSSDQPQPRSA
jgi:signal transduction histidine kinase